MTIVLGELAALGAALCWTLSAALYKIALRDVRPLSANISRCVSTSVFLVVSLLITGNLGNLATLEPYALLLAGLSGVIGLCLGDTTYMQSLKLVGVARAVPITCTYPLFAMLFEVALFGENVTPFLLMSSVFIVLGVWLISRQKRGANDLARESLTKGISVALVTAVVWSVSIILMDHAQSLSDLPVVDAALIVNAMRIFSTTSVFLGLSPLLDPQLLFMRLKRRTWVILALGGIVALGLGWFLLIVSLSYIQASRAVPISSISPLFAALFGVFLLREKVTLVTALGSVLVVLGTAGVFVL